jgi:small subunit ribosomal protein S13
MSRELRYIVRIAGTDIDGSKKLAYGLTKIRGIGPTFANAVIKAAELRPETRVGTLSESDVERLESVIRDPARFGLQGWLYNRRKDSDTGRDLHMIGPDLTLRTKGDIEFMKEIRTWKGVRHSLGLKVRGQRTKTTGRKGRAVGVRKKTLIEAARAAAAAEKEKKE